MANQVTVMNGLSKPVPVAIVDIRKFLPVQQVPETIKAFSYAIEPLGNSANIEFGIKMDGNYILETIGYYAQNSPALVLNLYFPAWVAPDVLGAVQGANIVPQGDARYHFALSPVSGTSSIAFTTMANIQYGDARLDINLSSPTGTNIPASARGTLTFQFRQRY